MAKNSARFVCQECGHAESKWSGKCGNCGAWNSFIEEKAVTNSAGVATGTRLEATPATKIKANTQTARLSSDIDEVDQVLGGGIIPGSVILLAGEPGIGKSTLLLQLANSLAQNSRVLYVSGEESLNQIKLRADRLNTLNAKLELATSTSSDDIAATISTGEYQLVVVDSIQTMATAGVSSSAGTVSQITNSAQLLQNSAKNSHTAVLIVGHVTKEGNIAGPKILEHLVDVVLHLEGERFGGFKLLRGVKNRFGSTNEVGIFEMNSSGMTPVQNPSEAFLAERSGGDGSVVFPSLEGSRAVLVEVQALVSASPFGYPKRTAVGFDLNRLNLLVAVLSRRAGLNLGTQDIYVNIVGGLKLAEPAADLAVCMAIASAFRKKPLLDKTVVFGEVGLSGEVRRVEQPEKRLAEAKKLKFTNYISVANTRTIVEAIKKGIPS